jgi:amino acid transporter
MKFRKWLFYGLAILVLLYIVLTLANAGNVVEDATNEGAEVRTQSEQELAETAATVGVGIGMVIVLGCGIPIFLFFALMGWRNGVGIRNEQRHREMLAAQQPHP